MRRGPGVLTSALALEPVNALVARRTILVFLSVVVLAWPIRSAVASPLRGQASPVGCGPTWEIVPSPNPGTDGNGLASVVALSATDVWAAGSYNLRNPTLETWPLFLHWDGLTWSIVPNGTSAPSHFIQDIVAIGSDDLWAVGLGGYVEHWDGLAWSEVSAPALAGANLWAAAGITANDVWTVGEYHPFGETAQTFIGRWDGTAWNQVPSPNAGTSDNYLYGIVAVSQTEVWAVGNYVGPTGMLKALIERWNGSTWSIVPSPELDTVNFTPRGVDSKGSAPIVLAGSVDNGVVAKTLIERSNGATWKRVRSPNLMGMNNYLIDVSLGTGMNAWAVGWAEQRFADQAVTLIERFAGGSWTIEDSADVPGASNQLFGSTVGPTGEVWAVGDYAPNGQPSRSLIERLCP
jgi:hypothetical protein